MIAVGRPIPRHSVPVNASDLSAAPDAELQYPAAGRCEDDHRDNNDCAGDCQMPVNGQVPEEHLNSVSEEISRCRKDNTPNRCCRRIEGGEPEGADIGKPDSDRSDRADAVYESEGQNEPRGMALQQFLDPRGGGPGDQSLNELEMRGMPTSEETRLVRHEGTQNRRRGHRRVRQQVTVGEDASEKRGRFSLDGRAEEDGPGPIMCDQFF